MNEVMLYEVREGQIVSISKAQASLDDFLAVLDKPPTSATGFTVKVRIAHRNGAEHLWIMSFRRGNSGFAGIVANEPDHLPELRLGQEVSSSAARLQTGITKKTRATAVSAGRFSMLISRTAWVPLSSVEQFWRPKHALVLCDSVAAWGLRDIWRLRL
jgi:hypothetical protein